MGLSFGSMFSVLGHVTANQTPACTNPSASSLSLDQFYRMGSPNDKITPAVFCLYNGKIKTALLNFGNAKRLCLCCLMRLCLFCLMRVIKIHGFAWADQDCIGLMIFKNCAAQDWIGFKYCESGLDSDWKISHSAHFCCDHQR